MCAEDKERLDGVGMVGGVGPCRPSNPSDPDKTPIRTSVFHANFPTVESFRRRLIVRRDSRESSFIAQNRDAHRRSLELTIDR